MNKICLGIAVVALVIMATTSPAQIRYILGNSATLVGLVWLMPLTIVAGVFYYAYKQNEIMGTEFGGKYQLIGMKGGRAKKKAIKKKKV